MIDCCGRRANPEAFPLLVTMALVIAYVDRSARPGTEGVYYLVTAGVVMGSDLDEARHTLTKLRPPQEAVPLAN